MKKLNNKGFAVSTLLYGLMLVAFLIVSILMSTMSTNRKNTSSLIKKIEEELNRYSQAATEFTSTDGAQEFIVPYGKAGWYKIELWGAAASGVNAVNETEFRRGAYTSGIIYLEENTHLYFQIGSQGGVAGTRNNIDNFYGGGSTDVRMHGGNWNDAIGRASRIMIAAGGTYNNSYKGSGAGYNSYYALKYPRIYNLKDGGSFIAGFAGNSPVTYNDPVLRTEKTYAFIGTMMVSGVNAGAGKARIEMISSQDATNPPSKKTNYLDSVSVIINCVQFANAQNEEVWREVVALNQYGENVAYGKAAKYGKSFPAASISHDVINDFTDGELDTVEFTPKKTSHDSFREHGIYNSCIYIDLGASQDLEEIRIFHGKPSASNDTADYVSNSLIVVSGGEQKTLINTNQNALTPTETYMGVSFSERNPSLMYAGELIPSGNYYIQTALSDNRFLSVQSGIGSIALFTGDKQQRWSITPVGGNDYKILEGTDQLALQPQAGGQHAGEYLDALSKYQEYAWEKWKIEPVSSIYKNGYYLLKSSANPNLCISTMNATRDTSQQVNLAICDGRNKKQWFKLINADY